MEELKEVSRKREALLKEMGNMQVVQLRKYEITQTRTTKYQLGSPDNV